MEQSLHSRLGVEAINGDGFGVGWYGAEGEPGVYHSTEPAWNDRNLRELPATRVALVFAHVRATTGTPVQQTNCHPFRTAAGLDAQRGDRRLRRSSATSTLAGRPALYPHIEGSTDSEVFFFLALTYGLEEDPPRGGPGGRLRRGLGRGTGRVPDPGDGRDDRRREHVGVPLLQRGQVPLALLLEHVRDAEARSIPRIPRLGEFDEETRVVVSEPLGDVPGVWNQVPEASWGVVQPGQDELGTFRPAAPAAVCRAPPRRLRRRRPRRRPMRPTRSSMHRGSSGPAARPRATRRSPTRARRDPSHDRIDAPHDSTVGPAGPPGWHIRSNFGVVRRGGFLRDAPTRAPRFASARRARAASAGCGCGRCRRSAGAPRRSARWTGRARAGAGPGSGVESGAGAGPAEPSARGADDAEHADDPSPVTQREPS